MKISAKSNMYTFNADAMIQNYAISIKADADICTLVVSSGEVSEQVRVAIEKSAEALNLGELGWLYLGAGENQIRLNCRDLWLLVEGLDPVRIIVCDSSAARLFTETFKTKTTHDSFCRVMCRNVVVFDDLDKLIQVDKQKAWALFKQIA